MSAWEVVIGLETHVQLQTHSKIFSPASTAFGAQPNTQAHPIDMALPGVLPVPNRAAVECAIRFGLAIGAEIAERSVFARKNYFYPDLPKGYQISQMDDPIVKGGTLSTVLPDGRPFTVQLTRAHLEEDAGKSVHEGLDALPAGCSGIDLNRAGTPLLEIVTEPVMRSAAEAVAYAKALHGLVRWIGICDGNLQEGSFRVDANVSVRPAGQKEFGTRCEIKNLNSFRFLERAIQIEAARQVAILEDGGRVVQETRLFDPDRDETRSMRSKEDAMDYRYFPDPDLPPLHVAQDWIREVQASMPALPSVMRAELESTYGLPSSDAAALTTDRATATYFEQSLAALPAEQRSRLAKPIANLMMGELAQALNRAGTDIDQSAVAPEQLALLALRIQDGTLSSKTAKEVFAVLWSEPALAAGGIDAIIDARGLRQIQDTGFIEGLVQEVIAANPAMVAEFLGGKDKALNALVGQVMKKSQGKVNPQVATEALRAAIAAKP